MKGYAAILVGFALAAIVVWHTCGGSAMSAAADKALSDKTDVMELARRAAE